MGVLGSGNVQCECPEGRPGFASLGTRDHVAYDGNAEKGAQNRRLPGGATPEPGGRMKYLPVACFTKTYGPCEPITRTEEGVHACEGP